MIAAGRSPLTIRSILTSTSWMDSLDACPTAIATEPSTTSNDRKANDFKIDVHSRIKIMIRL